LIKRCTFYLIPIFILCLTGQALAGAWTMKKGHMYNRLVFNCYYSDRIYGKGSSTHSMPLDGRFYDHNINWYEEYGVTDRVTFISSLYYKWLSYHDRYIHNRSRGPGDAELGLRYKLYDGPVVLSIQGLVKYGRLYEEEDPEIGNRQNDYEIRLLMGKSLWPFPGYCGLELGYRVRTNAPADEVRYLAEFGMNFTKRFYGRLKLDGIWGMGNADIDRPSRPRPPQNPGLDLTGLLKTGANPPHATSSEAKSSRLNRLSYPSNPTIAPEYNLLKLDITIGYQVTKRLGIELECTPSIYGEDTSKGTTSAVAITYVW
jgi:hypothetical protein